MAWVPTRERVTAQRVRVISCPRRSDILPPLETPVGRLLISRSMSGAWAAPRAGAPFPFLSAAARRCRRWLDGVAARARRDSNTRHLHRRLGRSYNLAGVCFESEPVHDPHAPHPCTIALRAGSTELFRLPLGHRNRRAVVGTHQSVTNEPRLGPEHRHAIRLNLTEDPHRLCRVKVDVPASPGYPQISRRDILVLHSRHPPQMMFGRPARAGKWADRLLERHPLTSGDAA